MAKGRRAKPMRWQDNLNSAALQTTAVGNGRACYDTREQGHRHFGRSPRRNLRLQVSHLTTKADVAECYGPTPCQCRSSDTRVHTNARNQSTSSTSTREQELQDHKHGRGIRDVLTQGIVLEKKLRNLLDSLTQSLTQSQSDPDEMEWENTNTMYMVPSQPPFWTDIRVAKIPTGPLSESLLSGPSSTTSNNKLSRGLQTWYYKP
ncbi:MAG: hypothetical protein M1830_001004 [Pleopsidium flavum]|nr:MAG: hypothetical protein M1830_001004 [Pleopsidium flavum]